MQRFTAQNDHPTNDYSFNLSTGAVTLFNSGGQFDSGVDDEYEENFLLNVEGRPGVTMSARHTAYGREVSKALVDVGPITGTQAEVAIGDARYVFLTFSGLTCALNGLSGGEEGRKVRLISANTGICVVTLGHMAGGGTPSTSRLFIQGLAGLTLGNGAQREAVYHGGLWYVG